MRLNNYDEVLSHRAALMRSTAAVEAALASRGMPLPADPAEVPALSLSDEELAVRLRETLDGRPVE